MHSDELQVCSPDIITMKYIGHVASIREQRNTHRILVKKLEGHCLKHAGVHRKIILKIILKEM